MASSDALRELHETYHVPNNGLLLLIGDVSDADALALAEEHFGSWERGPDPLAAHPPPEQGSIHENRAEILEADVSHAQLMLAFRGPDARDDFRGAVSANVAQGLTRLTGQGFRKIVGAPEVLGAGLHHAPSRDVGRLVFSLDIGSTFEAVAIGRLREALQGFGNTIQQAQVEAVRDELWARRFYSAEDNLSLAFQLANGWAYADLDYGTRYLDTLYDLDRGEVDGVIGRYIEGQPHAAVLLVPRGQAGGSEHLRAALEAAW